jgi:hypothetical protein
MQGSKLSFAAALVVLSCIQSTFLHAQHWQYDFGNSVDSCVAGVSSTLLPAPPAGLARVRIGSQGGGAYLLLPVSSALGTGSELCLRAPVGGSLNKVQFHDFPPGMGLSLRCRMRMHGGAGEVSIFAGNGSCFANNSGFTSAQVFTGLRWTVDSSGSTTLDLRLPSGWSTLMTDSAGLGVAMTLELYCNNGGSVQQYQHDSAQTVAAHSYDLWINGMRVADDVVKTGLPDTTGINSFMWYTAQSPGNALRLHIDDVHYINTIAANPLPVELLAFSAIASERQVRLRWSTATEVNNYGFCIERRRTDVLDWQGLQLLRGAGTSHSPLDYEYCDSDLPGVGVYHYRLRQIDRDGSCSFSPERMVDLRPLADDRSDERCWPQPARDIIYLPVTTTEASTVELRVYSASGDVVAEQIDRRLLPAGRHVLPLPCARWPRGILYCEIRSGSGITVRPLLLR